MRQSHRKPPWGLVVSGLLAVWVLELIVSARAGPAQIDFIERFQTNQVLIHFDTDADLTYELQYTETLTTNGVWTNLFVAPNIPFPNHYVVPDTGTRTQRFYRLHVFP